VDAIPIIGENADAAFVIIDSPGRINLDSVPSLLLMRSVVSSPIALSWLAR